MSIRKPNIFLMQVWQASELAWVVLSFLRRAVGVILRKILPGCTYAQGGTLQISQRWRLISWKKRSGNPCRLRSVRKDVLEPWWHGSACLCVSGQSWMKLAHETRKPRRSYTLTEEFVMLLSNTLCRNVQECFAQGLTLPSARYLFWKNTYIPNKIKTKDFCKVLNCPLHPLRIRQFQFGVSSLEDAENGIDIYTTR